MGLGLGLGLAEAGGLHGDLLKLGDVAHASRQLAHEREHGRVRRSEPSRGGRVEDRAWEM